MKKSVLLFAIIFSLLSCSKNDEPTTSQQENYRLSKITYPSGVYTKYTYNSQGKLAVMEDFSASNVSLDKTTYTYNSQDKLISTHRIYTDNFINTSDTQFTYNSIGYVEEEISNSVHHNNTTISKTTYTFNNSGGIIRQKTVYKNNSTGLWNAQTPDNDFIYTLNSQGKTQRIENANQTRKNDYSYDNNGNKKDVINYQDVGSGYVIQSWASYTYDDKINPENYVLDFIYNSKNKNNVLDGVYKYYTGGILSSTNNITNTYEYNAQGYPTKVNDRIYTYEKY
jgi:YD repeat-containing protein